MKKELDNILCEKYPLIFKDRYEDMSKTCMCWGFECGDGWYDLLDTMCQLIQNHIDQSHKRLESDITWNNRVDDPNVEWTAFVPREKRKLTVPIPQVVAIQVKEKYGTLRFYYNGGDDYIDGVIDLAEYMSSKICEVCGSPGSLNEGPWYKTTCVERK